MVRGAVDARRDPQNFGRSYRSSLLTVGDAAAAPANAQKPAGASARAGLCASSTARYRFVFLAAASVADCCAMVAFTRWR